MTLLLTNVSGKLLHVQFYSDNKKQIKTVDLHSMAIEQLRSVDPMVDGVTLTNVSVCCPDLTETMFLNVLV